MKWLFLVAVAVCSLAQAECRVIDRPGMSKLIECDASSQEVLVPKRVDYLTYRVVPGRQYNSLTLPSVGGSSYSAPQAMANDYYKDVGGYHPGMQLYRGKGFYTWYK